MLVFGWHQLQITNGLDIIFEFAHSLAGIGIHSGEVLWVVAGKDQSLGPDALQRTVERHLTSVEPGHVEINHVIAFGKRLLERAEAISFADEAVLYRGNAPAKMRDDDFEPGENDRTRRRQSRMKYSIEALQTWCDCTACCDLAWLAIRHHSVRC